MNNTFQVYEYSWLQFQQGLRGYQNWFKKEHYDALVDYHDNRGGDKYFELIRNGVRFNNYVGVIQVKAITIEILPKTDINDDFNTWHGVLLAMLRETRFLQLDYLSEASLRYKHHSILHLYFMEYLSQVNGLIRRGLVKKYRKNIGNVTALKGSLKFSKHISRNLIHTERFFTRHQIYDHQHIVHQILLEALYVLRQLATTSSLSSEVYRTLFDFPEIERKNITVNTFKNLRLDRKTEPYRKAVDIAKMIILNYSPDIKGGNNDLFALLFDMNQLWEEYIYRQMLKAGMKVSFQNSKQFWETRRMRPDLVLKQDEENVILDTKWKIIDNAYPSDQDLRQVFAYNVYWEANKGYLIYPKTKKSPKTRPGVYHMGHAEGNIKRTCQVLYVDVLNGGNLNHNLGEDLHNLLST